MCARICGHCDWLADNLRWSGDDLLVVHDWDSVTAGSKAVLAGFAHCRVVFDHQRERTDHRRGY